jgi:hypothetical protein
VTTISDISVEAYDLPLAEPFEISLGTCEHARNVLASDDTHVSVVGADDLVVAAFDDRVLVVRKEDAQRVRDVVAELRKRDLF